MDAKKEGEKEQLVPDLSFDKTGFLLHGELPTTGSNQAAHRVSSVPVTWFNAFEKYLSQAWDSNNLKEVTNYIPSSSPKPSMTPRTLGSPGRKCDEMLKPQTLLHRRHWRCLTSRWSQNDWFLWAVRSIASVHRTKAERDGPAHRLWFQNQSSSAAHGKSRSGDVSVCVCVCRGQHWPP